MIMKMIMMTHTVDNAPDWWKWWWW